MREKRWLLLALYGIFLANAVSAAVKARPKFKIATSSTTTTTGSPASTSGAESDVHENEDAEVATTTVASETNGTTGHVLTGIPQIDYIWDPNLPRELNGYNLSDYPFYNSIPEDIDFKCDGLHDGFYASVPHKCQVYHHCLFGTRFDFLCANFTAFDQKTFICHFVSEVDCANSKKYWHRNDALYQATTTTSTTTTTTTTAPPVTAASGRQRDRDLSRRRRPLRRRPVYEYYDEDYYDDDYSRPHSFNPEDYDYVERKYRRDRDRDFRDRDRDFRDRDAARPREGAVRDDRDRDAGARDRYLGRNGNRRDPPRARDPPDEEPRVRARDPEQGSRSASREMDDAELDDRRTESRTRDTDERRYSDKRYRDEYDEKETAPVAAGPGVNSDTYVKPAAPAASVYARPRVPPKIRRPVPLSEQDKYAYKATAAQSTEDPRRRPVDVAEDEYYEDELEDVRPARRPLRRRPNYRDRDRDFYDSRDRERDRPFRPRYREDEDDSRPRKHSDRSRDRYYDRDRDRGVDRGRDRSLDRVKDRPVDRDRPRIQEPDTHDRPHRLLDRDRDPDRPRTGSRSKEIQDSTEPSPKRGSNYDRTDRTSTTTTSTTCMPEQSLHKLESTSKEPTVNERTSVTERPTKPPQSQPTRAPVEDADSRKTNQQQDYQDRDQDDRRDQGHYRTSSLEEYSQEYYDEPEDPPSPPPRTAVRIVKRPFLPSRGGNPNPRGLSPVGSKAATPKRDEDKLPERPKNFYVHEAAQESLREPTQETHQPQTEKKETYYNGYKTDEIEIQQERKPVDYDTSISRPALRRPHDRQRDEEVQKSIDEDFAREPKPDNLRQSYEDRLAKWSTEEFPNPATQSNEGNAQIANNQHRGSYRPFKSDETPEQGTSTGSQSFQVKQRINEVTHPLQDIPESEYDVTLNDALTPTLNQETNLPSGFVLPLHRQNGRDTSLQSTENNSKVSRTVNEQQQKPFEPSIQFLLPNKNYQPERTVFYNTPEMLHLRTPQYGLQRRPWHSVY